MFPHKSTVLNGAFSESRNLDIGQVPEDYTGDYDYLSDSDFDSESEDRDGHNTERMRMGNSRGMKRQAL